jgi:cytochrome P450
MTIDFKKYPHVREAVVVDRYRDAEVVLVDRSFLSGAFERESAPFKRDTIFEINPPEHVERRRAVSPLFNRSAATKYEFETLVPSLRAELEALEALDEQGERVTVDLVRFTRLALVAVAARVIGLDATNRVDRLLDLADPIGMAADVKWSNRPHSEVVAEGQQAKTAFEDEFLRPAIAERLQDPGDPGGDIVSTMLAVMGPPDDPAVFEALSREAMIFLTAGVRTTAHVVSHTLHDLWSTGTTSISALSLGQLAAAANESLRLHPPAPALVREATESITLPSGVHISGGDRVAIDLEACNRDPEVFGADASAFVPDRPLPTGVHAYGLSFGAGPHVCLGKGLSVAVSPPTDLHDPLRSVVRVMVTLAALGIEPSKTAAPQKMDSGQDRWETYPVTLRRDLLRNALTVELPAAAHGS